MASGGSSLLPTHSYASISEKRVTFSMGISSVVMPRLSFVSIPSSHSRRRTSSSRPSTNLRKIRSSTAPTSDMLAEVTDVDCNLLGKPKKVLVPIGFGTEEMEAVVLVDILRRAGAEVTVASVEPQLEVETSNGTRFVANTSIAKCSDQLFDLVALPGGMPGSVRLRDCEILQKITKKQAEEKRLYGAISTAPAVTLLPWGLLRRKKTTGHPAFYDKLPTFWAVKSNIQVSGELTTSRGPGTSFQFALSLVEQLLGESVAKSVGEIMLMRGADENPRKEEFNSVDWSLDHNPRALIPVANGSEDIEVVIMADILRRAKVDVTIASVERSLKIVGSQGTKIVADESISDGAKSIYDLIILPGGIVGSERLQKSKILKKLLKEQYAARRIYGATNSSSTVLQKQGFLKEKRSTAYPLAANEIPNEIIDGAEVVIDENLITGLGLATISDFALAIVSRLFGHGRARSVAEGLVVEYPRT